MKFELKDEFISLSPGERLHKLSVPVLGLTGGIATGKSTIAGHFRDIGLPVIDADVLIKDIYALEKSREFIAAEFPEGIVDGKINFPALRRIAFEETKNRLKLEQFLYAELPEAFHKAYQKLGEPPSVVYDVPLLFEKKLNHQVDVTLCVYSPADLQLARIQKRDGIEEQLAQAIIDNQMSIEEKKSKSDFVIINTGEVEELKAHAEFIARKLFEFVAD